MSPVPLCHATSTGVSPSLAINMNCLLPLQHATFLQLLGPSEPHSLLNSRSLAFGMRSLLFLAIFAPNLASIPLVGRRGISGFVQEQCVQSEIATLM